MFFCFCYRFVFSLKHSSPISGFLKDSNAIQLTMSPITCCSCCKTLIHGSKLFPLYEFIREKLKTKMMTPRIEQTPQEGIQKVFGAIVDGQITAPLLQCLSGFINWSSNLWSLHSEIYMCVQQESFDNMSESTHLLQRESPPNICGEKHDRKQA